MPRKPPHPGALRKRIGDLVRAGRFSFGFHAFNERSPERRIDVHDAKRVLLLGEIEGPIQPGGRAGEWKCKMVAVAENSSRRIGVVAVLIKDERVFIVTVEWEDK